jgi:hypothetical protein
VYRIAQFSLDSKSPSHSGNAQKVVGHNSATFVLSTIGSQSVSGTARGALVLIIGDAAGLQNEIRYLNATAVMDI